MSDTRPPNTSAFTKNVMLGRAIIVPVLKSGSTGSKEGLLTGTGAPDSSVNAQLGDTYLDLQTGKLYRLKAS